MKPSQLQNSPSIHPVDSEPRVSNRVPMERKVVLKFHDFGGFSIEYSANVSTSGMFVKTTSAKPVGSIFIFEIWLGDERKLVHGLGEVVWIREKEEASDRPAGMGVSYLKLDDESRAAIARIVEERENGTGEPAVSSRDAEATASDDLEIGSLRPVPIQDRHSGELLVLDENDLLLLDGSPRSDKWVRVSICDPAASWSELSARQGGSLAGPAAGRRRGCRVSVV